MDKENKFLEFKREKTRTYLKTVSAFANYGDGEIRFGVDDKGNVFPISEQSSFALDIENQINDTIKPRPEFSLSLNPNGTVSLFVKKGYSTPYLFDGKAYRRSDTSTVEVDNDALKRLVLESSHMTFDEVAINSKTTLTFNVLSSSLSKNTDISKFNDDTLRSLGLLTPNGYNNAAYLLADTNRFPGLDIAVFVDNDTFKERKNLSHLSLISQFEQAIEIFERNYVVEKVEGEKRISIEKIPLVAFREAIANAIVHRMYDVDANTKVAMYPDHIEISSPGGLMYGLSKEQFLRGAFSALRNPLVANVFRRLRIIEAFATGIERINKSYSESELKPSFDIDDFSITISLPSKNQSIIKTKKYDDFLKELNPNIKYSRSEIEKISGISKTNLIRLLNEMIDEKLISKEGNGKATLYYKN